MPVIIVTQDAEISSKPTQANCSRNPNLIKGLVKWLKVYALSSNLSTTK
jgi:hypothetical protein